MQGNLNCHVGNLHPHRVGTGEKHIQIAYKGVLPTLHSAATYDLREMSSINKQMTALFSFDRDSEIEEDMSETEDHLEVNSESEDSNYETNEEAAIYIHPKKAFPSKMVKYSSVHPQICVRQNCLWKTY